MTLATDAPAVALDPVAVRRDFPILHTHIHGRPLIYLDNGATTQKPQAVIDAVANYYAQDNANIHRGVYELSQRATEAYESARQTVQRFINARESAEVIFTRGTTESINLVARSFGERFVTAGDEIVVTGLEHHSNIVPWQMLCQRTGATLRVIPIDDRGDLVLDDLATLINDKTKLVACTHLSNSLGTVPPVEAIIAAAHGVGAKVLIDGAQWVAHAPTDVRKLNADFYVFSGHKLFGPTGIGVLYGRRELLEAMPPFMGGGDMIESVTFERTTYAGLPNKFEAGTPNIAGAVGLAAAIDYVQALGIDRVAAHERALHPYLTAGLDTVPGLRRIGTPRRQASVASFIIDGIDQHTLGISLDLEGVAVRTGHHCCQPVMDRFKIPGTARASIAAYTTSDDIDALVEALRKITRGISGREAAKARSSVPSSHVSPAPDPSATQVQPKKRSEISATTGFDFPEASAASPRAAADQLAEEFSSFDDPQDQYAYLIELGERLPPMPDVLKNDATRVHGCMSVVHLLARERPGSAGILDFFADSDGSIVRGLIAILQRLFAGQTAADILAFDIDGFFRRVGLDRQLTLQRRTGLEGMIRKLREAAQAMVQ